jgi:hypothetical protein
VQILARMQLEAEIDAGVVECVQDRPPAARELVERVFDQTGRSRWIGIEELPQQAAGEGDVAAEAQVLRCFGREQELLDRSSLARDRPAVHLWRCECVHRQVVGRVAATRWPIRWLVSS